MVATVRDREVSGGVMPDRRYSFCVIVPHMNLTGKVEYFFISLIIKQNRSRDIVYFSFFLNTISFFSIQAAEILKMVNQIKHLHMIRF